MTTVESPIAAGEPRSLIRVSMALTPTLSLGSARLFQLSNVGPGGEVSARWLATAIAALAPPGEARIAVDLVTTPDPMADAESFVLGTDPDGPELRARLYEMGAGDRLLLLAGHPATTNHAVMAGWATRLRALLAGDPPTAAEPHAAELHDDVPRADLDDPARTGDPEDDWAYWRDALAGDLAQLDLGGRSAQLHTDERPGLRRTLTVDADRARRWRALAARCGVGVEVLAITGVALLLRRYLGVADLVFALPLAGARGETVAPLRLVLADDADLGGTVRHVADRLASARRHLSLDPGELTRRLNPPRLGGRSRLDQIHLAVDTLVLPGRGVAGGVGGGDGNGPFVCSAALGETGPPVSAGPVILRPIAMRACHVPGELRVAILTTGGITLSIQHPAALDARVAQALSRDLATIIDDLGSGVAPRRVLARPTAIAADWPAPARVHRRGTDFVEFPSDPSHVADRFRAIVNAQATRTAIIDAERTWTYAELAALAGGYAAALITAGVGPGDRAGIYLDQGAHAVAAMLGTLAVGAAYVPLDPTYPDARIAQSLITADLRAVVTTRDRTLPDGTDGAPFEVAAVQVEDIVPTPYPATSVGTPDDVAYILYTSGSTGCPKGVAQTHGALLAGLANHVNNFRITPSDRLSVLASYSYDMALCDVYGALLAGAVLVPIDVRRQGLTHLAGRLADARVTIYHSTPTLYRYLVDTLGPDSRLPDVRAVLLGGEEASVADVDRARRHFATDCVFVNGYGATEATFVAQHHLGPTDPLDRTVLPIGFALPGYHLDLCDPHGNPAVLTGELVIRSRYVAPGYWREPALTAERFGTDPDGMRWYRTGDLARRLPDGRLVHLGRLDRQVKIRGYRVELGEVEAHLAAQPGVVRAVAFPRPGATGEPELYAYAQAAAGQVLDGRALRAALARRVPDFALPRVVAVRTELPLTPTGKVDVGALPTPAPAVNAPAVNAAGVVPRTEVVPRTDVVPRTETERLIATIWRDTLGVAEVNIEDNFFDVGGHSLLMAVVQRELASALGWEVALVTLFLYPTVGSLAAAIEGEPRAGAARVGAASGVDGPGGTGRARIEDRMARRREARTQRVRPADRAQRP